MNWLDIVIIVLIIVPVFIGLRIGIIKAVLSLAGVIIGIILAGQYHSALGEQLGFISSASLANIVAFAIILVIVMLAAAVLASVLRWITKVVMLGWVNRLGGAAFGFILGALFCSTILATWAKFLGTEGLLAESSLAAILLDYFPVILALLPGEFDSIRSFF